MSQTNRRKGLSRLKKRPAKTTNESNGNANGISIPTSVVDNLIAVGATAADDNEAFTKYQSWQASHVSIDKKAKETEDKKLSAAHLEDEKSKSTTAPSKHVRFSNRSSKAPPPRATKKRKQTVDEMLEDHRERLNEIAEAFSAVDEMLADHRERLNEIAEASSVCSAELFIGVAESHGIPPELYLDTLNLHEEEDHDIRCRMAAYTASKDREHRDDNEMLVSVTSSLAVKRRRVSSSSGSGAMDSMDLDDDDSQSLDDDDDDDDDDELYSDVSSIPSSISDDDLSFDSMGSGNDEVSYSIYDDIDTDEDDDDRSFDLFAQAEGCSHQAQTGSRPNVIAIPGKVMATVASVAAATQSALHATMTKIKSIFPKLPSNSNDDDNSVDSLDSLLCYARDNCPDSTFKGMSLEEMKAKPATLCSEEMLGRALNLVTSEGPMRVRESRHQNENRRFEFLYKHPYKSKRNISTESKQNALRYCGKTVLQLPHTQEAKDLVLAIGYGHDEYTAAYSNLQGTFQIYNTSGKSKDVGMRVDVLGPEGDDSVLGMAESVSKLVPIMRIRDRVVMAAIRSLKAAVKAGRHNTIVPCGNFRLRVHDASVTFVSGIVSKEKKRVKNIIDAYKENSHQAHKFRVDVLGPEGDDSVLAMAESALKLKPIMRMDSKVVQDAFRSLKAGRHNTIVLCGNFRLRVHDASVTFVRGIVQGKELRVQNLIDARKFRVDVLGPEGDDSVLAMATSALQLHPIIGKSEKAVRAVLKSLKAAVEEAGPDAIVPCGNFRLRVHDVRTAFVSGIVQGMELRVDNIKKGMK
eukprot:scaffold6111_cov130-Skeletonema_menzelii.AAC.9